jgi:aromatic-L-amino-acid decarboxylase
VRALEISNRELSRLADEAMALAKSYWASVEERRAYPVTDGEHTTELFSRPWSERGLGRAVVKDFDTIAEHSAHQAENSSAMFPAPASLSEQ